MAAINISAGTNGGVDVRVVQQELVFFIGPSPDNPLDDEGDYARRCKDVKALIGRSAPRHTAWLEALNSAFGTKINHCAATLRQGGKRGLMSPNLCIDLVETLTADGAPLFPSAGPENTVKLCRALVKLLDSDWVDVWYTGTLGNAKIDCERNGHAVHFPGGGKKVVLS